MEFSDADKLKAIEREIALRRNVYPRNVARGTMTQAEAERQIAIMLAIAEDYRTKVEHGKKEG